MADSVAIKKKANQLQATNFSHKLIKCDFCKNLGVQSKSRYKFSTFKTIDQ